MTAFDRAWALMKEQSYLQGVAFGDDNNPQWDQSTPRMDIQVGEKGNTTYVGLITDLNSGDSVDDGLPGSFEEALAWTKARLTSLTGAREFGQSEKQYHPFTNMQYVDVWGLPPDEQTNTYLGTVWEREA